MRWASGRLFIELSNLLIPVPEISYRDDLRSGFGLSSPSIFAADTLTSFLFLTVVMLRIQHFVFSTLRAFPLLSLELRNSFFFCTEAPVNQSIYF